MARKRTTTKTPAKREAPPKRRALAPAAPLALGAVGLRQETPVRQLALSADGRWLATGDQDGVVRLCDLTTGQWKAERRRPPEVPAGDREVRELALSADGGLLAARYRDWLWIIDAETLCDRVGSGTVGRDHGLEGLAFAADGRTLLGRSVWGTSRVDPDSGARTRLYQKTEGAVQDLALSPDRASAAIALHRGEDDPRGEALLLLDPLTGAVRSEVKVEGSLHQARVGFRADGRVVVLTRDSVVLHWKPGARSVSRRPLSLPRGVKADSAGARLVAPGAGLAALNAGWTSAALVDLDTGALRGHAAGRFPAIVGTPDGATLAIADGVALDLRDGRTLEPRGGGRGLTSAVSAVAFEPDGAAVWTGDATSLRRWSLPDGAQTRVLEPGGKVARLTADAGRALVLLEGGSAVVALPSGKRQGRAVGPVAHDLSPDGKLLATVGGKTHLTRLWTTSTGKLARDLDVEGYGYGLTFSPSGRLVAAARWGHAVSVWEAATGAVVAAFGVPGKCPLALALTPDETLLALGSEERAVRLFALPRGQLVRTLAGHTRASVHAVTFSPDGALLATSDGKDTRLWAVPSGEPAGLWKVGGRALAFSADGRLLAVGGEGAAWVLDVATAR